MSAPFRPKTPSSAPHTERVQADPQPVVPMCHVETPGIEERGSVEIRGLDAPHTTTLQKSVESHGYSVEGEALLKCSPLDDGGHTVPDGTCDAKQIWVPNLRCRACREAGLPGGCAACLAWTERARVVGLDQAFREMDREADPEGEPVFLVFESDDEGPPQGWEDAVDAGPRICLGCCEEISECCCKDLGP
jgi:hypothetical protein